RRLAREFPCCSAVLLKVTGEPSDGRPECARPPRKGLSGELRRRISSRDDASPRTAKSRQNQRVIGIPPAHEEPYGRPSPKTSCLDSETGRTPPGVRPSIVPSTLSAIEPDVVRGRTLGAIVKPR